MDPVTIGYLSCGAVLILLAIRVPIAYAIGGVAIVSIFMIFAWRTGVYMPERAIRTTLALAFTSSFDLVHNYDLSMIPLFIALGHVAYKAGITTEIYEAARVWLVKIPGGVAIASIAGCAGFSAISGSSIACASTMGRICTPEMLRLNYDPRLATASVAAGGTLGSLIPPSVLFIIYGIFTESSISKLFLAGILPGILSMLGYALVVVLWVRQSPEIAPVSTDEISMHDKIMAAVRSWPAVLLFMVVIGGIYGGIFTATEAAAVALLFATALGVGRRLIKVRDIVPMLASTMATTGAIFFIAACAKIFVALIALTGLSNNLVGMLGDANLAPWLFIIMVAVIYLVLGMFLDPIGIMVLTLPLMIPMVESYDMNLIWFGVVIVKLLEIGLITPPVGLNVFVLAGVLEGKVEIGVIFAGLVRFLMMDIVVLALLIMFPIISTLIPTLMR